MDDSLGSFYQSSQFYPDSTFIVAFIKTTIVLLEGNFLPPSGVLC